MARQKFDRKLVLEDGTEFHGYGFGADRSRVLELVFNTSMVGYQEILSDPACADQGVVMTYTLIGNYGMADDDYEMEKPAIGALVVREYNDEPSNFRSTRTLSEVMREHGIPGIQGIDTRKLTRIIRDKGSCKAYLTDGDTPVEAALEALRTTELPRDAVARVSIKRVWQFFVPDEKTHVAVIDCGMARSFLRMLNQRGCTVTVLPWDTTPQEIESLRPGGVIVAGGPGDPADARPTIELVKALRGKLPMLGISLGHEIIALAYGANTYKLPFGRHGSNHPVRDLRTGSVEVVSHNHSYAVEKDSLNDTPLEVTHVNLLDGTVEGVECRADRVLGVQYRPVDAPGPQGSPSVFDRFFAMMEGR